MRESTKAMGAEKQQKRRSTRAAGGRFAPFPRFPRYSEIQVPPPPPVGKGRKEQAAADGQNEQAAVEGQDERASGGRVRAEASPFSGASKVRGRGG